MRKSLILILFLAACAEPRAACVDRAGAELRALDKEIADTKLALARGYRDDDRSRVRVGAAICAEDSPITLCLSGDRPLSRRGTAINPTEERARLRRLEARRASVAEAAERAALSCPTP